MSGGPNSDTGKPIGSERIDVLLVDDDSEYLNLEKLYLKREDPGFNITAIDSVEGALRHLDEERVDIVVSDYMMPDMNGLEFLHELREEKRNDVPFIMLTGKGREEVAMEALNLGADRYIQKSGDPKSQFGELAQAIAQEVEHMKAKERIVGLNSFLMSIRNVNQLIVQEEDLYKIMKGTCDILLETRGYLGIGIALLDDDSDMIKPMANSGQHDSRHWSITPDGEGDAPRCIRDTIVSGETNVIDDPERYCRGCKYFEEDTARETVVTPMIQKGKIIGIMSACMFLGHIISDDEPGLLEEVAGDLGFAREKLKAEGSIRKKNLLLTVLNEYSLEVASVPVSDDIFSVTAHRLRELTNAKAVSISTYDKYTSDLVVRYTTLTEKKNKKLTKFLGRRAEGLRNKVTPEMYERITSEIVGDAGTLHETTFGAISKPVGMMIQKLFGIEWFTGIALMHEDELMGTIIICGDKDTERPDNEELKAFAGVTANAFKRWNAERSLLESQGRWRFALEGSGDGIWDWNIETGEISFSRRWKHMLGYGENEIDDRLKEKEKRIHEDDIQGYKEALKEHLRNNTRYYENEHRIRCKDGTYKWVLDRGKVIDRSEDGKPLRVIGVQTDISHVKEAEKALRKSEEKFLAIARNTPDHIIMQDCNLRYVLVINHQLGLTDADMIGKTDRELPGITADEAEKLTAIKRKVLETGEPFHMETSLTNVKGETEYVKGEYTPHFDSDGKLDGLIGYFHNITERKQAEEALSASEERYRRLFESAQDGILILDAGSGTIIDANPYILDMLDISLDKIKGKNLWEISPFGDIAENKEKMKKLQEVGYVRYEDLPLQSKDGKEKLVEFISNTYDAGGTKVIQCNIREITARKKAERAVHRREEHLSTILLSIGDAVIVTDEEGNIDLMNPVAEKLTGWSMEEAKKHPLTDVFNIVNSITGEPVENPVDKVLESGKIEGLANHTMLISKDGKEYQIADSGAPLRDREGKVSGVVLVFRDVTSEYEAEEDMKKHSRDLEERVKELNCIYKINRLMRDEDKDFDDVIHEVLDVIPEGLMHPNIIEVKIDLYGDEYTTDGFEETDWCLESDIRIKDEIAGHLKVCYTEKRTEIDDGPFLKEEKELIDGIADVISNLLKERESRIEIMESEEKFRTFAEGSADAIFITDQNGNYIYVNQTASDMLGYAKEELLRMNIIDISREEDVDDNLDMFKKLLEEGKGFVDIALVKKDGKVIPVELNATLLPNGLVYGSCRDITERKKDEYRNEFQLELQETIASISSRFVNISEEEYDDVVEDSLQNLGELFDVDRSYMFRFSEDQKTMDNTHEWCSSHAEPQKERINDMPTDEMPCLMSKIFDLQTLHVPDVSKLPPEAETEKAEFESQNIKSLICLPIYDRYEKAIGFIGMDSVREKRDWSDQEIPMLKVIAEIIGGSLARLESQHKLNYRLEMESLIADISSNFVQLPIGDMDNSITDTLRIIGLFSGVDRSYIFLFDEEKEMMNNTHEWCVEGIEPQIEELQNIPVSTFPWWMERLERFESFQISNIDELPPEASNEKEILESQDIISVLIVPLVWKKSLKGFIGLDSISQERKWPMEDVTLLETLADVFINAMERKKMEESLKKNEARIKKLYDASSKISGTADLKDLYDTVIRISSDVLDFDVCTILIENKGKLTVKACTKTDLVDHLEIPLEKGIAGKTYLKKKSYLIRDLTPRTDSIPTDNKLRSGISVPLGDIGVFQAESYEVGYYVKADLEIAELFVSHIEQAIHRIHMEEREEFLHSLLRHDVKNKAQIVQGYIQLLEEYDMPEEMRGLIEKPLKANQDIVDLINKIRLLERASEETLKEVNIDNTMHETVDSLKTFAGSKNMQIEVDCPEDACMVKAGSLVKEIFSNIVENSIYHSEGTKIRISGKKKDDEVICTIEDDGKGIPDDKKEMIFEKEFTTDKGRGTGLGMFLVKNLLKSYGGSIEVKDSELGGARFDIHLKLADE